MLEDLLVRSTSLTTTAAIEPEAVAQCKRCVQQPQSPEMAHRKFPLGLLLPAGQSLLGSSPPEPRTDGTRYCKGLGSRLRLES